VVTQGIHRLSRSKIDKTNERGLAGSAANISYNRHGTHWRARLVGGRPMRSRGLAIAAMLFDLSV